MQLHKHVHWTLTPAARIREVERLTHMARRAYVMPDMAPQGMKPERYAQRLERQALAQLDKAH